MSECGTRIYYKPSSKWKMVSKQQTPDYLLVNYQTSGESVGSETLIPKYARNVMYAYMDCGRKEYNSAFNESEKLAAYYNKIAKRNDVIAYLNPIDVKFMSEVQDAPVKY